MGKRLAAAPVLLSDGILALRRPEPEDTSYYWALRNHLPLVTALMGFRLGVSRRTVQDWIARQGATGDDVLFTAVNVRAGGAPVGYVKAFRMDRYARTAWIGLSLFRMDDARKGYGGRLIRLLSRFLREHLGIRKISVEVLADNAPARALFHRQGFVPEGRMRAQSYGGGRFRDVLILSRFLSRRSPE